MTHRLLLVVVLLCGLAGCATTAPAPESTPTQLQFHATTLDGADFSGESLLGKPAAFWFWTPWCPTCQREAPMVAAAAAAHPDVTVVGVASASEPPAMREFVDKYGLASVVTLADTAGAVWAKFGVTKQPAFAFLTPDGHVDLAKGPMSADELDRRLAGLTGS